MSISIFFIIYLFIDLICVWFAYFFKEKASWEEWDFIHEGDNCKKFRA